MSNTGAADTNTSTTNNDTMQRPQFASGGSAAAATASNTSQQNDATLLQQTQQHALAQQYGGGGGGLGGGHHHPPIGSASDIHPITDPEDPLLIAQSLTYVTDDGSVNLTFASAPFSASFKIRFLILEILFVVLLIFAVPIGAHGTVVSISLGNLFVVAWFWYNSVRSVEVLNDGALRFWIGNVEVDVPFEKIVSLRRINNECSLVAPSLLPHRGYLTQPTDGVAILTTAPSMPLFLWPRSAGKPERALGPLRCPRLKVVFSPAGGGMNFVREVEAEMRGEGRSGTDAGGIHVGGGRVQPPAFVPSGGTDLIDV